MYAAPNGTAFFSFLGTMAKALGDTSSSFLPRNDSFTSRIALSVALRMSTSAPVTFGTSHDPS